jgi:hypothetical protein
MRFGKRVVDNPPRHTRTTRRPIACGSLSSCRLWMPLRGGGPIGPMISAAIAADQCMENQPSIPAQCRPQPVSTISLPLSIRPSTNPGSGDLRNFDTADQDLPVIPINADVESVSRREEIAAEWLRSWRSLAPAPSAAKTRHLRKSLSVHPAGRNLRPVGLRVPGRSGDRRRPLRPPAG